MVRVTGESALPALVPGKSYLASNIFLPKVGDFAVFRNPRNPAEIFVKRVTRFKNGRYMVESMVSWGASSSDFGLVARELILGKIIRKRS